MDKNGTFLLNPNKIACSLQLRQFGDRIADQYKLIITTMIMAYCNYGTELEHLQKYKESTAAYRKGLELAQNELGEGHILTQNLNKYYSSVVYKKQVNFKILLLVIKGQ